MHNKFPLKHFSSGRERERERKVEREKERVANFVFKIVFDEYMVLLMQYIIE